MKTKVIKTILVMSLIMNIGHVFSKDLGPQEYEGYVISDPQEPSDEIPVVDARNEIRWSTIKITKPGDGLTENEVWVTCGQVSGGEFYQHEFGPFESDHCAQEHIAQNADKCNHYSHIWN